MSKVRQVIVAMGLVLALLVPTFGLVDDAAATSTAHCSVATSVSSSGSRVYATASAYCSYSHYGIVMLKVNGVTRADSGWYTGTWFSASQSRSCSPGTAFYVEPFAALYYTNGSSKAAYGGGYSVICQW